MLSKVALSGLFVIAPFSLASLASSLLSSCSTVFSSSLEAAVGLDTNRLIISYACLRFKSVKLITERGRY